MTLQQMKYALTIAEQGSMNKAAEQLFISGSRRLQARSGSLKRK